jgi:probable rRNA maturation factor
MAAKLPQPRVLITSSQSAMRVPRRRIARLVRYVARAEGKGIEEVDLAVVSASQMAALNRRWLDQAGATDVLSFDLTSPTSGGLCCQIVVCAEVAVREARRRTLGLQRELLLYVVHGLLHAMGYDDTTPVAAETMRTRQEQLLDDFRRRGG